MVEDGEFGSGGKKAEDAAGSETVLAATTTGGHQLSSEAYIYVDQSMPR